MTVHVFVGPTLPVKQARQLLPDAVFLPPVSQGDVLRSAARKPAAIGIIDGRFHDVPAVWHKEILWAMSRGVPVYGSASMGALRAAELAAFGMRGVGEIFKAYHSGAINDDDEVAVAHSDAESGYQPTNEAMVSIRATLSQAERAQIISAETASELERLAKQTYYTSRSYPRLLLDGREAGLPAAQLDALRAWLPNNRVDQKALDAREMLRLMAEEEGAQAPPVPFKFEHTAFFEQARQTAGELSEAKTTQDETTAETPTNVNALEILDELRLNPGRYREVWERAALRTLVDATSSTAAGNVAQAAEQFRRARGLTGTDETRAWLQANDLSVERFGALVGLEHRVSSSIQELIELMPTAVVDLLRIDDTYGPLVHRILAKREFLAAHGLDQPLSANDDQTTAQQLRWYFDSIGEPVPEALESHWQPMGFTDQRGFLRAVRREFHYRTLAQVEEGSER